MKKNNNAFGLLMLFFQVAISAIYGTVIQIQAVNINIVSIISMILLAILIVAGTLYITQDSDLHSDIRKDCYGVVSASHF